jgi:hypothetical protein
MQQLKLLLVELWNLWIQVILSMHLSIVLVAKLMLLKHKNKNLGGIK